ncbi:Gfo/Idh/MocA family oxidoreductase [Nocardioides KLBMP 9356]|uniref:Gfo/Idh/MocA family oxidoreductase n=1 Tax=Nocardioides potassii TaxID=2911371 RepID=A0ABS9HA94_9ACTN|nr:Gfo/Idh/MocA family oxidoreductase [Nocardioides potassii]MCF6378137.1 Gfo/Idh/MocA family oxidoreductase [Nocardioides potassii]
MNHQPLRVALIGPGRISVAHLDAITHDSSLATLVAVCGLPEEKERTEELATRFSAERAVHDTEELLASDDVDAVVVTVPNHVHAPLAVRILQSGKHVLMEKPLANSVTESDTIVRAAEESGLVVMVGQCRRFFRGAQQARDLVESLGRPLTVNHHLGVYVEDAATDWWRSAREAGGLAVGLNGPHVIDTMLWLVDAKPTRVYAQTRRLRDKWEGEDEAIFVLEFDDGSLATGHITLNAKEPVNLRWVNGPNGSLHLSDDRNLWRDGVPVVGEEITPYIEGDASFRAQFAEFVNAVREGRPARPSAEDGRRVVAIMEAIQASQEKGQPITL